MKCRVCAVQENVAPEGKGVQSVWTAGTVGVARFAIVTILKAIIIKINIFPIIPHYPPELLFWLLQL